jgi:hypothetical protein
MVCVLVRWLTVIGAGSAIGLLGCGSSTSHRAASITSPSPSRAPNGEASKPPSQVLADAASALRHAHAYELRGTIVQGGQRLGLQLAVSAPSLVMTAKIGGDTYQVLRAPSGYYVRGNRSFWTTHLGPRGAVLADRWIHTPAATGLSELGNFAPGTLARCLTEDHGTLSRAGTTTVNGQPAVVLRDAGNLPGTQPGTLAIAATGTACPLRLTATGRQRPGGRIDVCNNGHAASFTGTLSFRNFNHVAAIHPPADAIQVPGVSNA